MPWLFLVAYTCSGLAGLIYEVSWTRLLTLHIGHTTAAASAVVAAFLGGLAVGAAAAGPLASRWSPRQSLRAYVGLELGVVVAAALLPLELSALTPILRWAYGDGEASLLFPVTRVAVCLVMVFIPAFALGATFPLAIRWFADGSDQPARQGSTLYFLNTLGAAAGALLAGFVLIPRFGIAWTTYLGMTASLTAGACGWLVLRASIRTGGSLDPPVRPGLKSRPSDHADRLDRPKGRGVEAGLQTRLSGMTTLGCRPSFSDSRASHHCCMRSRGRAFCRWSSARPPMPLRPRSRR